MIKKTLTNHKISDELIIYKTVERELKDEKNMIMLLWINIFYQW